MQLFKVTLILITGFLFSNSIALSQDSFSDEVESKISVKGVVSSATDGKPLAGANIMVTNSDVGAASDLDGSYTLENIELGAEITVSVIGYKEQVLYADSEELNFSLENIILEMGELEVLASRAGDKTAVAYTDISKEEIALRLGSRDVPLALNTIPSVYATGQGGGAGDARINVRGFNQNNVAIMLNGIPVNDMENGWVYWSNWDGVADATSSIQMQKGLSAQNLATPSIGGSMNIITDPSAQERRGLFKQELGAWGFLKTTLSYHSGLILDDKLALSATLVRKVGDGYVQGTWTDASAYYIGASYNLNDSHKFQFYALGAPQRHGQNLYKQNMAAYSNKFTQDRVGEGIPGYDINALGENGGEFVEVGRDFNQNVAPLSEASQTILDNGSGQHWQMYSERDGVSRHQSDNLAERENFFHKPLVALNHYFKINDQTRLSSSAYWSGGMGGGTGTYGDVARLDADGVSDLRTAKHKFFYGESPWTWDWDGTIAANNGASGDVVIFQGDTVSRGDKESIGILRNSNNRQSTIGALSKLNFDVNENLKTQVGIDYRYARIYHVKTVRDLLGGDYFVNTDSDFDASGTQKGLGDPIDYNFTNYVNWLGLFGQAEYTVGDITSYAMAGFTTIKYSHWNHNKRAADYSFSNSSAKDGSDANWVESVGSDMGGNDGELFIEADAVNASQFKGGILYSLGDKLSFFSAIPIVGKTADNTDVWVNFGLIDKAPIMDQVLYEDDGDVFYSPDAKNEKFNAFELGFNFNSNDGTMAAKLNLYNTSWNDRILTRSVPGIEEGGDDNLLFLSGVNQVHSGIEFEFSAQLNPMFRLDLAGSLGNWEFTDDAEGSYRNNGSDESFIYSLKGLKVGDSPQANFVVGLTVNPVEGASIQALYRYYGFHYSDWSPDSREVDGTADRAQVWKAPNYGVMEIHASYDLPVSLGSAKPRLYLNVFNAFDALYVQDAVDNSKYNGWNKDHDADDAEVYFGIPLGFNAGVSIAF